MPPAPWRSFKFFDSHDVVPGLAGVEVGCADLAALTLAVADPRGGLHLWDRVAGGLSPRPGLSPAQPQGLGLNPPHGFPSTGPYAVPDTGPHGLTDTSPAPPGFPGPLTYLRVEAGRGVALGLGADAVLRVCSLSAAGGCREVPLPSPPLRATALCVAEDLRLGVVALEGGDLLLLRGDLAEGRGVARTRLRPALSTAALRWVGLPAPARVGIAGGGSGERVLYASHEDRLTAWRIAPGGCTEFACPAVDFGAADGNAALSEGGLLALCDGRNHILLIGRGEGEGEAPFDPTSPAPPLRRITLDNTMPMRRILWHRNYLVGLAQDEMRLERFYLQCYDLQNNLRVLSRSQEVYQDVCFVFSTDADILVIAKDPERANEIAYKLTRLCEIDTQTKMEALFSKECYDIARNIASRLPNVDPALQVDVQRRYADYLYRKGRYSEAIEPYIECIGHLEPSYVIRRYRQPPQLPLLARYLEALHCTAHGYRVSVTYTTLLLKVYIRMRKEDAMLAFLHREDVRFDAKEVIAICREAGYHKAALYLSDKYACVGEHASILLYNLHQPRRALEFIETLGVEEAEGVLARMGKDLLSVLPLRTTELLTQLSVDWKGPPRRISFAQTPADSLSFTSLPAQRAVVERLLHVFIGMPACLLHYLRALIESGKLEEKDANSNAKNTNNTKSHRSLYNTLFELYITADLTQRNPPTSYQKGENGEAGAEVAIFPVEPLPQRQAQALSFLDILAGRYEADLALSLSYLHHFDEGVSFLQRRMGLWRDALRFHAERLSLGMKATPLDEREAGQRRLVEAARAAMASASAEVSETLWKGLLRYLAQNYAPGENGGGKIIAEVLDEINTTEALAPALVVELLSNPTTITNYDNVNPNNSGTKPPLGIIRGYLEKVLLKKAEHSARLRSAAKLQSAELDSIRRRLLALHRAAVVFSPSSSSSLSTSASSNYVYRYSSAALPCARCGQALDLPSLRFKCGHGVHQRCCEDPSGGCGVCAPKPEQNPHQDDARLANDLADGQFFKTLQSATSGEKNREREKENGPSALDVFSPPPGGFSVVADYIRAGALNSCSAARSGSLLRLGVDIMEETNDAIQNKSEGKKKEEKELYDRNGDVVNPGVVESW
ncbi:unnamed protein product [Phytomonas sp. Hart1]|nr:unnamed protein product [Phytomonas sp. Hart1]|eukprot:CCW69642.1 unnamed protein product [Phytomonas sp. isolate Hart1]